MSGPDLGAPAPWHQGGAAQLSPEAMRDANIRAHLKAAHSLLCGAFSAAIAAGHGSQLLGLLGQADCATLAALRDLQ